MRKTATNPVNIVRAACGLIAHALGADTAFWTVPRRGRAGYAWPMTKAERGRKTEQEAAFRAVFGDDQ